VCICVTDMCCGNVPSYSLLGPGYNKKWWPSFPEAAVKRKVTVTLVLEPLSD
jgi:hypothetical protein